MKVTSRRYTLACLTVLVCLSGLIQAVVIARATVPSIDCVRFVSIAQRIDAAGFVSTFRAEGEQPLFPLAVCWMHVLLAAAIGDAPSLWALSAQLAAAAAAVPAVIPIYFISRRLAGSCGGFIAAVFFCALPEVARLGADGIADGMHLLFFALAFWGLLEYFRAEGHAVQTSRHATCSTQTEKSNPYLFGFKKARISPGRIILVFISGLSAGLAVLTRAETVVLFPALFAAELLGAVWNLAARKYFFCSECKHKPAGPNLFAAAGVALAASLVIVPYLFAVGSTSPRDAVARTLGRWNPPSDAAAEEAKHWLPADGRELAFDVKEPDASIRRRGLPAAVVQFGEEAADAFNYVVGALSLLGIFYLRRIGAIRFGTVESLIIAFCTLFTAILLRFTAIEGYLTARHLLLLVVLGIGPAGVGAIVLAHRLQRGKLHLPALRPLPVIVFFVAAVCLATALRPLRPAREADRRAGCWLAEAAGSGTVLDTKGWAGLYSARTTFQYDRAREAFADPRLAYVVVQREDLLSTSSRGRTLRFLLGEAGEAAAAFAGRGGRSAVDVYRWHPERFRSAIASPSEPSRQLTVQTIRRKGSS